MGLAEHGETFEHECECNYVSFPRCSTYRERLRREDGAQLMRVRWYGARREGDLGAPQKMYVERKTHRERWTAQQSIKVTPCKLETVFAYLRIHAVRPGWAALPTLAGTATCGCERSSLPLGATWELLPSLSSLCDVGRNAPRSRNWLCPVRLALYEWLSEAETHVLGIISAILNTHDTFC